MTRVTTATLELWATGDICDHLNVTRTTIGRWRKWPDFPPPRWTVSRGTVPIWDAAEVHAWHEQATRQGRVR